MSMTDLPLESKLPPMIANRAFYDAMNLCPNVLSNASTESTMRSLKDDS